MHETSRVHETYKIGGVTPEPAEKLTDGIVCSEPEFMAVGVKLFTIA